LLADAGELFIALYAGDLDQACEYIFGSLFHVGVAERSAIRSDNAGRLRCARLWGGL
jgi:hypothetical protein